MWHWHNWRAVHARPATLAAANTRLARQVPRLLCLLRASRVALSVRELGRLLLGGTGRDLIAEATGRPTKLLPGVTAPGRGAETNRGEACDDDTAAKDVGWLLQRLSGAVVCEAESQGWRLRSELVRATPREHRGIGH